jgi:hypothetical protein
MFTALRFEEGAQNIEDNRIRISCVTTTSFAEPNLRTSVGFQNKTSV